MGLDRRIAELEASRELDNFILSNGLQSRRASSVVKLGHVATCVRETAAELQASVVAFGAKGKSRFEANVIGSVSEEFLSGTGHDVLLAKAVQTPGGNARPDRFLQTDTAVETAEM